MDDEKAYQALQAQLSTEFEQLNALIGNNDYYRDDLIVEKEEGQQDPLLFNDCKFREDVKSLHNVGLLYHSPARASSYRLSFSSYLQQWLVRNFKSDENIEKKCPMYSVIESYCEQKTFKFLLVAWGTLKDSTEPIVLSGCLAVYYSPDCGNLENRGRAYIQCTESTGISRHELADDYRIYKDVSVALTLKNVFIE